jgi:hypothetical protein
MIIKETRNIADFLPCVPFEMKLRKKGRDKVLLKNTLSLLKENFENNPALRCFIAYENNEIVGYLIFIFYPKREVRTIHIHRICYDKNKEILNKFIEIIEMFANESKCRRLTIDAFNNERALSRKWGFRKYCTVMERSIKNDESKSC